MEVAHVAVLRAEFSSQSLRCPAWWSADGLATRGEQCSGPATNVRVTSIALVRPLLLGGVLQLLGPFRLAFFFRSPQPGHTFSGAFPAARLAFLGCPGGVPGLVTRAHRYNLLPAARLPATGRDPGRLSRIERPNQPQTGSARAPRTWGAGSSAVVVSRGCRAGLPRRSAACPGSAASPEAAGAGEERADQEPFLGGVTERAVGVHAVTGAAASPGAGEVARGFQVGHDGLHGAFGDAGGGADVADPGSRVAGDLHQHVPVPGQQRPAAVALTMMTHTP